MRSSGDRRRRGRRTTATGAALAVVVGILAATSSAQAQSEWWEPTNPPAVESEVNVTGAPFTGTAPDGDVRGYVDAHTHMFSDEGFGGHAVCGATFSPGGIADALKDCDGHRVSLLENLTNSAKGAGPLDAHDTTGWPTFPEWPTYSSFTHQQMYYKWVERAWRGGQRIMVNDLVSNTGLCTILGVVAGPNEAPCNDMDAVRREARKTYELQAYVDAQYGGAGQGWFRVVTTPQQARSVVEQGKLAVVLGVEVSEPFGCKQVLGVAQCSKGDIDRGLDELKGLGVSSMFLCHKFDNALCGVRYDEGTTGLIVNVGQFLTTGTWWNPQPCKPGQTPDNTVIGGVIPKELAIIPGLPAVLPLYPTGPHCNPRGLSDLGEYALKGMMQRNMMVELDHMSAKAADRAFDLMEAAGYPGALSSHSWLAGTSTERLYQLGGFATQYGHSVGEYVADWQATRALREKYGVGYGYGTDMNGFGGTPAPPADDAQRITYPFTSVDGGAVLDRQRTGQRVWDYNVEGVAHYGMVPDWIESLRRTAGSEITDDLMAGAQSYLDTWNASAGWAPGTNLARGAAATASSTEWTLLGRLKPPQAVDGSLSTRWASAWGRDSEWFRVDLATPRQVSRVTIDWEDAYASRYRIETSLDGSAWSTDATVTASNGGTDVVRVPTTSARYVRVVSEKRATQYGISIRELGVFS
ncbi:discoidin domain-containing protein [Mumia qirimensis]|uniref:discoidin domain-containing protein n=1 Tax=Mumia qirimensis TaxID=3234852 RepID=UPI00351D2BB0